MFNYYFIKPNREAFIFYMKTSDVIKGKLVTIENASKVPQVQINIYMYLNIMLLTRCSTSRNLHEELNSVHAKDGVAHMAE